MRFQHCPAYSVTGFAEFSSKLLEFKVAIAREAGEGTCPADRHPAHRYF